MYKCCQRQATVTAYSVFWFVPSDTCQVMVGSNTFQTIIFFGEEGHFHSMKTKFLTVIYSFLLKIWNIYLAKKETQDMSVVLYQFL